MWVRVIAWDDRTDQFLGILINQPYVLRDLYENDNVVFAIDSASGRMDAVGAPRYAAEGWPATPATAFTVALREGIRAYRAGRNGHNMPGIERCIAVLQPAVDSAATRASSDERFVGHFVLGRCLAEKYETERAIAQFRQAIALRPDDLDSHMALLAELTIANHRKTPPATPAQATEWERQFASELADIKTRFPNEPLVRRIVSLLFDASQLTPTDSASPTERARLARVGYAIFRWKRR